MFKPFWCLELVTELIFPSSHLLAFLLQPSRNSFVWFLNTETWFLTTLGRDLGQIPQRLNTVKYFTIYLSNTAIPDNKLRGEFSFLADPKEIHVPLCCCSCSAWVQKGCISRSLVLIKA